MFTSYLNLRCCSHTAFETVRTQNSDNDDPYINTPTPCMPKNIPEKKGGCGMVGRAPWDGGPLRKSTPYTPYITWVFIRYRYHHISPVYYRALWGLFGCFSSIFKDGTLAAASAAAPTIGGRGLSR